MAIAAEPPDGDLDDADLDADEDPGHHVIHVPQGPGRRKCSPHDRAQTMPAHGLSLAELAAGLLRIERGESEGTAEQRPQTRAECLPGGPNEARPCPWVSCRHHLGVEVDEENGSIKVLFPGPDGLPNWDAMIETCALDVADRTRESERELELEEIGRLTNRSRERVYQISNKAYMEVLVKRRKLGK